MGSQQSTTARERTKSLWERHESFSVEMTEETTLLDEASVRVAMEGYDPPPLAVVKSGGYSAPTAPMSPTTTTESRWECERYIVSAGLQRRAPIAFSPDGNLFAAALVNGVIDVRTADDDGVPTCLLTQIKSKHTLLQAVLLPQSEPQLLVAGGDAGLFMWSLDVATGSSTLVEQVAYPSSDCSVTALACSPDGVRIVAGRKSGKLDLLILQHDGSWKLTQAAAEHKNAITCIASNGDASKLASGSTDADIKVWAWSAGDRGDVGGDLLSASIGGEEETKDGGGDGAHHVDDSEASLKLICDCRGHLASISCLVWQSDGEALWSGSVDRDVSQWQPEHGTRIRRVSCKEGNVVSLIVMRSGTAVALMSSGSLLIFSVPPSSSEDEQEEADTTSDFLSSLAGGSAGELLEDTKTLAKVRVHSSLVHAYAFCPGKPLLLVSAEDLSAWDVRDLARPQPLRTIMEATEEVTACDEALGMLFTGSPTGVLSCYDSELQFVTNVRLDGAVTALVARGDERGITIYAGTSFYRVHVLKLDDSFTVTAVSDAHSGQLSALALTPRGDTLLSGSRCYELFGSNAQASVVRGGSELPEMKRTMKYAGLPGVPRAMAVSLPTAEGKRYLAVGDSSHRVSLFRVKDGSLKWKWKADHGHGSAITAVAWGKNERSHVFFTGGVDKRIKVWQIKPDKAQKQDGNVLPAQTLRAHKARICDLVVRLCQLRACLRHTPACAISCLTPRAAR
eukprot:PLAT6888.4.p1 GENE.PLAT6888.4~~PLAT6888.4.p1  ORF type:complete len:753 (-),score=254.65 PLAT6888.4:348-2555(-)